MPRQEAQTVQEGTRSVGGLDRQNVSSQRALLVRVTFFTERAFKNTRALQYIFYYIRSPDKGGNGGIWGIWRDAAEYSEILQRDTAGYGGDTAGYRETQRDTAGCTAGYSGIQRDTARYSEIQRETIKIIFQSTAKIKMGGNGAGGAWPCGAIPQFATINNDNMDCAILHSGGPHTARCSAVTVNPYLSTSACCYCIVF
jgi:hypothetical protein